MANEKPCLQAQITIDSTNKWLDVDSSENGVFAVDVAEGTYDDIHALLVAIDNALENVIEVEDFTVTVSDEGIVTITCTSGDTIKILGETGTHGLNNDDDHINHIIGHDDVDDVSYAASQAGGYQHMYGWYPDKWPASFGPWNPKAIGGEQRDTLSGSNSKKLHAAFHHFYDVEYTRLPPEYVYSAEATGSDLNKDLEHVWEQLAQSKVGRWFEDASDSGTYTEIYLKSPFDWTGVVTRPHRDYKAYNIKMRFREKEP